MEKKDYYKILGIEKSANEREIKRSYKRLAIKYHPDRNQYKGSESKFKEIKEAYEVLIDSKKRAAYDQYGHAAFEQSNGNYRSDFGDIFGDVFGDIFGRDRHQQNMRGSDLCYKIEITLEEAVLGVTKKICIPTLVKCNTCFGIGTKVGTKPHTCVHCHGSGQIQMSQGFFTVQQTCSRCHGKGTFIKDPCKTCQGQGRVNDKKTLSVKIPTGIDNEDRIRLSGEGEYGQNGAASGDLYVQIHIKKHPIFQRQENNLYCEVPIDFSTASLGGNITVPTLDGKVNLKIPTETQTGKLFRIRGKGIKSIRNHVRGDFLCRVIIETPINLNDQQKSMLQKFKDSLNKRSDKINNPRSKKFLEGIKKFFENFTR